MRKALIFVCAFVVSSMVIYMFYYYSQQHKLSRGIVANANHVPKTNISPIIPKHFSDTSYMGNLGLLLALDTTAKNGFSAPPARNYVTVNGVYNNALINDVNEDISSKFPNHPPIGFTQLQQGQKILFSYYFENIILPDGFKQSAQQIDSIWYRTLRYTSTGTNKVKAFFTDTIYGIEIDGGNGNELVICNKPLPSNFKPVAKPVEKGKIVEFPEIDFNIIKYWKPAEAEGFIQNPNTYSHIEQRVKFKLSLAKFDDGDLINKQKSADYKFVKPFYLYVFKKGAAQPYLILHIHNNELLLPLQPKSR